MHVPIQEKEAFKQPDNDQLTMQGRALRLAQIVWLALVILLLGVFIAALPPYFSFLQTTCITPYNCFGVPTAEHIQPLESVGLTIRDYAWFNVVFSVSEALICLTLGLVIFWHKSFDRMAWLASLTLIFTGTTNVWYTFLARSSPWPVAGRIFDDVAFIILVLFFALFPNGRFVPRWTRLIPIIYAIYCLMPFLFSHAPTIVGFAIGTTVWVGSITSIAVAQIYRYRGVSTRLERQQTKWVVFGLTTTVMINIGCELLGLLISPLHKPGSFYTLFLSDIELGSIIFIPISVAIAILRSRLWEIDVIINRTLVYGLLTGILALLYVGLVLGLQFLFDRVAGPDTANSPLILVGSTLIIAALFQPLRRRIQNIIDRRFYRSKYNARRTVANFSTTLRGEVELKELSEQLVAVVEETMQPVQVSLWLNKSQRSKSAFYNEKDSAASAGS